MSGTIIENKTDLMRNLGCTRNSYFLVRYGMNMISHYANHLLTSATSSDFAAYDVEREDVATLKRFLRNMADAAVRRGGYPTRKDNWQKVFEPIFGRAAFVQETFQRIYPIRICTMHARLITQDDELYLYVETKRILAAIGIVV